MEPKNLNTEIKKQICDLHKVTPLSKYLTMTIFIVMPFIAGWIGYTYGYVKNVEVEKVISLGEQNILNDTSSITLNKSTDNFESASNSYVIVSPRAGDKFQSNEDIAIIWDKTGSTSEDINVYLVPYHCELDTCNQQSGAFSAAVEENSVFMKEYVDDTVQYTIDSATFPAGNYRAVIKRASESSQQRIVLAVSDSFQIMAPIDETLVYKAGDKAGAFVITDIRQHSVTTTGTTTMRGKIYKNEMFDETCFDVISDDAWKIPRVGTDVRSPWFCFRNEVPKTVLEKVDIITIEVANYLVDSRPMETTDSAEFMRFIE